MAKSDQSHSRLLSAMRMTRSPGFTPASTSPDPTASTSRRMSVQLSACHARVSVADDLRAPDHLLQLVDPAVQHADLFLGLLVLGVVLDVPRLERFLEPLARLGAPAQGDFEISLELLEALGRQQYRFG